MENWRKREAYGALRIKQNYNLFSEWRASVCSAERGHLPLIWGQLASVQWNGYIWAIVEDTDPRSDLSLSLSLSLSLCVCVCVPGAKRGKPYLGLPWCCCCPSSNWYNEATTSDMEPWTESNVTEHTEWCSSTQSYAVLEMWGGHWIGMVPIVPGNFFCSYICLHMEMSPHIIQRWQRGGYIRGHAKLPNKMQPNAWNVQFFIILLNF